MKDDMYVAIFSSQVGQKVLCDILAMCHFGQTLDPDNPVQVAEYNVGAMILAKCGVFRGDSMTDVVRSLMSVAAGNRSL